MIGTRLSGRYEIAGELGRGGMGVVYRARDPLLNREVAVKLIPPTLLSPEAEQRFQREAQLVAQMDHPSIVPIYDFGQHDGSLFFVMPVVEGANLRSFLRERALLGDIVDIGVQLAEALEYSHARGVVHRDIKPENIMVVREEGGGTRVRVMDFGLALGGSENRLTRTGAVVGTLCYLSPEQVSGQGVDGRCDVYSLGAVLYECVAGEPPFVGEVQSVLYRIVHEIPQPPRALGAEIDEELERLILSCLEKDPAGRPQRAGEVAEGLKRYRSRLRESDRNRSVVGMTRSFLGPRPAFAPFVGRSREYAELQQRLNAAVAGECQFVVVGGEPGIGKTRLLDELETLAKARKLRVLHGRCVEQDGSFPYQGFCEVVQESFRVRDPSSGPLPDFSDLAAPLLALFPMLTEISEIRSAVTSDPRHDRGGESPSPENRTQIYELLARVLTRIAAGRPLLLFLEDLHSADVSVEALQYIVRRLGPTPTLIVGTFRSTETDARHPLARMVESFRGDRRFCSLELGRLSPSEHRLFLQALVGSELSDSLVVRLYEGAEGNPFFTKELVRSLLDSGAIAKDASGSWTLSGETAISTDALPATIQQAVEGRIKRLPEELREILSIASVIGRTFDSRDLEALAEGKGDVDEALDRLVREGLIEEERESRGDRLVFASGVVRDVLYASLSRRKRRSLHRKYAEQLEARHKGRPERVYAQLVYHFSQGDVPEKAVDYGLHLARTALDAFSPEEAARSARTALEFLDEEWTGDRALEGDARLLLARACRLAGDIDSALMEADAATRTFEQAGQPTRAVGALLLAAETAWQARRIEATGRWVELGLSAARAEGQGESLRQFLSLGATLANLAGEYEKANAYLEEAERLGRGSREAQVEGEQGVPRGGRLIVAMANPVSASEPAGIRLVEESEILTNVYETLVTTDAEGNVVPALCERWEARDGGRAFLLVLREGVRFEGGQVLEAVHVKNSFERSIRQLGADMPAAFAAVQGVAEFIEGRADGVAGIVALDERRLEIRLVEPLAIYPVLLADSKAGIVHRGEGSIRPLGTGPFRITAYEPGRIVLERSADAWRGSANLDAVEFRTGLSAAAIASGLRSGDLDVARDLLPQDLEEILRDPRFRGGLVESPQQNTYFVLFNTRTGPAARNPTVRRALAGIVRTRDLVWRTVGRFAEPAASLIPPGMLGHDPGKRRTALQREQALELLRSAALPSPIRLTASVHPLLQDRYSSLTKALFDAWAELGVEVTIATPTMESFLEADVRNDSIDMKIGRWVPDYDDPDDFTYSLFHSRNGRWRAYFASAEADEVLEEARAEGRPAAREGLYRRFEGMLLDAFALVPLFHDVAFRVAGPQVRGLRLRGSAPFVNYASLGKVEGAAPVAEARRAGGGIISVPIVGVVGTIDPALSATAEQAEVVSCVYETLTRTATDARIVPWLAAEFGVEGDGRRYRFRLREDVRFHDGRRLTARDVRYSFERLLQKADSTMRWYCSAIRGAKDVLEGRAGDLVGFRIHSAVEFSVELEEPLAFFPALLTYDAVAILPEGTDSFGGSWQEGCVGTGPFRVVKFEPGARIELERNKTYWRKGYPRCEGLVFTFGVPPKDILSEFRAGRFALASDLFPADVEALRREPEFASGYRETPRLATYYAAFNRHQGALQDKRLRQRLVESVDMPSLVRQTLGRLATPAHGFIPPGLLGHEPSHGPRGGAASPSSPLGAEIELTAALHPVFFGGYSALARELSQAFRERGVRIRPVNQTMPEWMEATFKAAVDIVVGRWVADYPDSDTFVHQLHSQEGILGRLLGGAEIDRLVERGRAETAPAARHAVYREIEELIARESLLLPLFHEQAYRFARPEIEGLSVFMWGRAANYEELRFR